MPRYFSWMRSSGVRFFVAAVAPFVADALVQALGEGFGEAIGDGFGHDGVVVVVVGAEAVAQFLQADPAGDGEGADVIGQAGFLRRDEVGERAAGLAAFAVGLLAEEVEARRGPRCACRRCRARRRRRRRWRERSRRRRAR